MKLAHAGVMTTSPETDAFEVFLARQRERVRGQINRSRARQQRRLSAVSDQVAVEHRGTPQGSGTGSFNVWRERVGRDGWVDPT